MAKRSVRAKKRLQKKSLLQKLFTFPKIGFYSFVALALFTVYQVNLPSKDVLGLSSWQEGAVFSEDEAIAEAKKNTAAGIPIDQYIAVALWKGNMTKDTLVDITTDNCLKKQFTVKLNGKTKTLTQHSCGREAKLLKVTKECNNIEFVKVNSATQYNYTGAFIEDHKRLHGKAIPYDGQDKTYEVCGFPEAKGDDGWGFVYNEVVFGAKKK